MPRLLRCCSVLGGNICSLNAISVSGHIPICILVRGIAIGQRFVCCRSQRLRNGHPAGQSYPWFFALKHSDKSAAQQRLEQRRIPGQIAHRPPQTPDWQHGSCDRTKRVAESPLGDKDACQSHG
jgi:hypothetical protein